MDLIHSRLLNMKKSKKNKGLSKKGPYKTYKHISEIMKKMPILKASPDFMEKLERRIEKHESKISKSKRKSTSKSSKE